MAHKKVNGMKQYTNNIFISYAKEDFNQYVVPVINILGTYYFDYWLDIDRINVGDIFLKEIEEKILNTNKFIIFISTTFMGKQWCKHELDLILENKNENKIIMPILCGEESIGNIQNFSYINAYAFETLNSTFLLYDIQKIVHRIIKAIIRKSKKKYFLDYTRIINHLNNKSIYNKDVIIYFIHLLADNITAIQKETIIITSNIMDLILSDIMQKHGYHGKISTFISAERFPQEILTCLAIIYNSKLLIMNNNGLSRLLHENCIYALSVLLDWYLS